MSPEEPRLRKGYRHVWLLPDDIAGQPFVNPSSPRYAWAAFGPRGGQCGVESTVESADQRSQAAAFVLGEDRS